MKKEFVPYELAVKLKELGFDEPCLGNYRLPSNRLITEWEINNTPEHVLSDGFYILDDAKYQGKKANHLCNPIA